RCTACTKIRQETECTHPNRCYIQAQELLSLLPQKWNPTGRLPEDYEPKELEKSALEHSENFDWRITTQGSLADVFRIFTDGDKCNDLP
ncbi:hypothetical protein EV368DRAFT_28266, partial [Lentinula lateritia]